MQVASVRRTRHSQRGFSTIEMVVVVMIVMIVAGIAIIKLNPTRQQQQADAAMIQVSSQLRKAREIAIEKRRDVTVTFSGNNSITLTQLNLPAGAAPTNLGTIPIQAPAVFMTMPGMPDTPDGFGNTDPVYFNGIAGGPPGMMFQSDGTFVDAVGNYVNGTVFIGIANVPSSARAVTVLGATGNIRTYKGTGTGWAK
jgi:type II secretory pathway pseudopilin PulG